MNTGNLKYWKLVAMAVTLPFIYGCGAGAGVGSLVGFLFGSGGGGGISLLASGGSDIITGASSVASLVNPEPASMLLVGSGLAAMSYFKSKSKQKR